jgi:hypothetical protein
MLLPSRTALLCFIVSSGLFVCMADDVVSPGASAARWRQHDVRRPRPPIVEPASELVLSKPPRDAVVLFDGTDLAAWKSSEGGPARWNVADGVMETVPGTGMIETKEQFGDIQLHIEWATPSPAHGSGQDRGNSGVFLMGQFEIQVLDSYNADTYADGLAGAIYGQFPPIVNASRPPGAWQSYDIAFRRPRFGGGKLLKPARITVFHNGILIQNNEEPFGPTSWLKWLPYEDQGGRGPLSLQDHDHTVRYRNIWVRELPERPAPTPPKELERPKAVTLSAELLDRYAGRYRLGEKPDSAIATITREGGHLTVSFPFRPEPLELTPISETQFDMPYTDGQFTFHQDASGQVTSVLFRIGDGRRDMKRLEP